MKRTLSTLFGIAWFALAAAQTSAPTTGTLPPVQPPPDLDATPASKPPPAEAPRSGAPLIPLGNSDAEAQAAAAAEAKASTERSKALAQPDFTTTPPVDKAASPGLPPDVQKAAEATELPVITVRQNGNERVEEYRKHGVLYFVRVMPQEGPARYYVDKMSNIPPDLTPISGPSGVVQPVYYKLFDWH